MKFATHRIPRRITGDPILAFWAGEARARCAIYMSLARAHKGTESKRTWVHMARIEHRNYCKYMRQMS
jgi:hypothetical protein